MSNFGLQNAINEVCKQAEAGEIDDGLKVPEEDDASVGELGEGDENVPLEEGIQGDGIDDAEGSTVIDIEKGAGISNSAVAPSDSTSLAVEPKESGINDRLKGEKDASSTARRRKRAARKNLYKPSSKRFI